MTDNHAANGNPLVDHQVADLAVHLHDAGFHDGNIVLCMRKVTGNRIIAVFRIRHIDINDAIQKAESVHRLVSPAVIDKRDS